MTTNSLRPGVFSSYTVTSSAIAGATIQYAAVCACALGGVAGKLYRFTGYAEAAAVFSGGTMLTAIKQLLEHGVSQVVCVAVSTTAAAPTDESYTLAFEAVSEVQNIGVVLCDSHTPAVQSALLKSINGSCEALKERVAMVSADTAESAAELATLLNSERICLCYPASTYNGVTSSFVTACAFAGMVLASAVDENLSGSVCTGIVPAGENLSESSVQTLLGSGVTVFEAVHTNVECIKAVTTRTKTSGVTDYNFSNISTIRIIDQILQRARNTMKALLKTAKSGTATMQSMASQMTVLLAATVDEGLLRSFEAPRIYPLASDASVCVIELSFAVATAINQIHITAHIQL